MKHMKTSLISEFFKKLFSFKASGIFIVLIGLIAVFVSLSDGAFTSGPNVHCILRILPELGLVTAGMGILLISGEFDLSVGSELALCSFVGAVTFTQLGWDPYLSLLVVLLMGITMGILNGLIVTKLHISSLIATLGTMWVYRGILFISGKGFPVYYHPEHASQFFHDLFVGEIGGIPIQMFWLVGAAVFFYILLNHSRFGNWIYSTGSNKEASRMMGVNTDRVKIICFAIVGMLVAIAAVMQSIRVSGAYASQGMTLNLQAIAAAVVGGVSIYGGKGGVIGAVIGATIVVAINSGLLTIGVSAFYFNLGLGLILIVAVVMNTWLEKRRIS